MKDQFKTMMLLPLIFFVLGQLTSSNPQKEIETLLDKYINKYQIPAIGVSIIRIDSTIYAIRGERKLGSNERMELDNKFHLGSNTKAITAFVAMKLVEEKKLSMDVKLTEIFPKLNQEIHEAYKEVELRDLFQHNGRIRPFTDFDEFDSIPKVEGDIVKQRSNFMSYVLTQEPVERGSYSNAGLVIAAHVLEEISGRSFEDLLDETMNELGLEYCIGFPNRVDSTNAWGHMIENDSMLILGPNDNYILPTFLLPAGDVAMDLVEYSRFISMHFFGLLGTDNYLESTSYNYLHYGEMLGQELPEGKNAVSTFGWGFLQRNGIKITTHTGSAGTYFCQTLLIPEKDLAIIIMTNSAEEYQEKGFGELRKELTSMFLESRL